VAVDEQDHVRQILLGRVDIPEAGGVFALASEGEDILVKVMSFVEACAPARAQRNRQHHRRDRSAWLALRCDEVRERST